MRVWVNSGKTSEVVVGEFWKGGEGLEEVSAGALCLGVCDLRVVRH